MKISKKITDSIFFVISAAALAVGLIGSAPIFASLAQTDETNESARSLAYDNPNLGFTLEYPADWTKEESLSFTSPMLSSSDEAPESISVTTEVLFSNITLEEYSDSAISILEDQFANFTLIESSNSTLSGYPAHQIVYTYTFNGVDLKNFQIWTMADNIAYAITYGGITREFDDSLPVIKNMIDSFELTEIQ